MDPTGRSSSPMANIRRRLSNPPDPVSADLSLVSLDHVTSRKQHKNVRQWSTVNNQILSDRELSGHAVDYVAESARLRSQNLTSMIEDFKLDPEGAMLHLQIFLDSPANSLATAFDVEHMARDTKILQAMTTLCKSQYVVITGFEDKGGVIHRDALWDRHVVFDRLLSCEHWDHEVHTLLEDVPV